MLYRTIEIHTHTHTHTHTHMNTINIIIIGLMVFYDHSYSFSEHRFIFHGPSLHLTSWLLVRHGFWNTAGLHWPLILILLYEIYCGYSCSSLITSSFCLWSNLFNLLYTFWISFQLLLFSRYMTSWIQLWATLIQPNDIGFTKILFFIK